RRLFHLVVGRLWQLEQLRLLEEGPLAADAVDRPVPRGRRQPGAGIGGGAFPWPTLGRNRERLLGGFLGEVEVAEEADQRREDAAPLLAEDLLEQRASAPRPDAPRRRRPCGRP